VGALKLNDSFNESMNRKKEIERISQNLTIWRPVKKGAYENNHVGHRCGFAGPGSGAIRNLDLY
jgi:hypothetical protein